MAKHRNFEVLTERSGGKIDIRALKQALVPEGNTLHRASLARQVDSCFFKIAECLEIVIELGGADARAQLHQPRVTGLLDTLGEGQRAVALHLVALDSVSVDDMITGAERGLGQADQIFLQRHGCGDDLEGRAGHIYLGDRLVVPGGQQKLLRKLAVFLAVLGKTAFFECLEAFLIELPGVIEVEGGINRNGQHVARVDVHDNAARAVFAARFDISGLDLLVKRSLHEYVNGGVDLIARHCGDHALVIVGHFVAVRVTRGHVFAVRTLQVFLIGVFQAVNAHAVAVGKADGVCGQGFVRIVAGGGCL